MGNTLQISTFPLVLHQTSLISAISVVFVPLYNVHKYTYHFYCYSQLEKQQKLNELNVVVSVKLHQIQYMINGVLPQDLSQTLVFESNGVSKTTVQNQRTGT